MVRVLIVDDNDAIRCLLARLFRSRGYEVYEAADGLQALDLMARQPFDAVLMGVPVPRMDGWEMCRQLRRISQVPILMMLAIGDPAFLEQVQVCGASAIALKPVEFDRVLSWVHAVSDKARGGSAALPVRA
jgi:CheY-like chemotaxis protein